MNSVDVLGSGASAQDSARERCEEAGRLTIVEFELDQDIFIL